MKKRRRSSRHYNTWAVPLLLLALGVGIFLIVSSEREKAEDYVNEMANPTSTPMPTATPVPDATAEPTSAPTPVPTATPEPTAVPTAVPSAVPTMTPTPTPVVDYASDGSFRSDTGTWLNVIAKWETVERDGKVILVMEAYAESYSLFTGSRKDDVVFTINAINYYDTSEPISIGDNSGKVETLLGRAEAEVPSGKDVEVSLTWYFMGEYGGQKLDSLTATDIIHIPG